MSRKVIDLSLKYDEIRDRIEEEMVHFKKYEWAEHVKVSQSLVSNVHKKEGKEGKRVNPSLEYIIAVARVTGKPVEWYLYGETLVNQASNTTAEAGDGYGTCADSLDQYPEEIKKSCRQLKDILLSDHPVIKPALLSNLAAFQHSVEKEKSQEDEIRKLNRRLQELESWRRAKQRTGTDVAASSSTGKPGT